MENNKKISIEKTDNMKNPCLIIIDMQEKLFPVIHNKEVLLNNIEILIKGFQLFDFPILVTEQVPHKLGKTIDPISSLFENFAPIVKSSFSCVGESKFISALDNLDSSDIVLVGIETHVCVYQTAMDLINKNKHVEVVTNGVASRNIENHNVSLSRMDKHGVFLNTVEMLLFSIQQKAEGERFRQLIKLLK